MVSGPADGQIAAGMIGAMNYELYMGEALEEARAAVARGERPHAAVAVLDEAMVARGHDRVLQTDDPTAHAVIVALREAARRVGSARLRDVTMFATMEPCPMCVCAMTSCGVVGSTSTVLDGEGVYSGGVLVGSTGAACAIGDKAKLQPRVWQEIQAGLGLVFAQLETKDRALQDLSERIFTIRRAKLDMEMASAGEALL